MLLKQRFDIEYNNAKNPGDLNYALILRKEIEDKISSLRNELSEIKRITKMNADADRLRDSSLFIRKWLIRQPSVKEESITDWLLFDISEKINGVYYSAFSRHEEAQKTGADWEWWFIFQTFSMKLRVQAKRLTAKKDNYPALAYINRYGLQIEKLINDAKIDNFIPLYAFYTAGAELTMCGKNILDEGVYLAGGKTLYKDFIVNGKKAVSDSDILKRANPLSCLLGCPLSFEGPDSLVDYFKKYYPNDSLSEPEETQNIKNNDGKILGYHKEPPDYINSFIQSSPDGLPDWWESEFRDYIKDVNALLVYDTRGK